MWQVDKYPCSERKRKFVRSSFDKQRLSNLLSLSNYRIILLKIGVCISDDLLIWNLSAFCIKQNENLSICPRIKNAHNNINFLRL